MKTRHSHGLDAGGHVVAPGFIDIHNHNVPTLLGQKVALVTGPDTFLKRIRPHLSIKDF